MEHHVIKHKRTTFERIEKFISPIYFTDVNLYGRLYPKTTSVDDLAHFAAPGRIPVNVAMAADYKPVKVGQSFGPIWSTHWFRLTVVIPDSYINEAVYLLWKSESEAMVWHNGQPIQGLSGLHNRMEYLLTDKATKDNLEYVLYIEMACNTLFGVGNGMISPPDENRKFTLSKVEIATRNQLVYHLLRDFDILYGMAKHFPETSERGYQALYAANNMINTCLEHTPEVYNSAIKISEKFFSERNGDACHTIHAIGHCHIDTAWLWPYAETIRKCARSWSSTLSLMEKFPNFKFACSQAQQFEWIKQHYPSLYTKIKAAVKSGRFIPVGGTWVEMDCNIPSGESLIRQFLYGQLFFKSEFDLFCSELWIPDTFGYSVQLPQIMKHCGINKFVTQKISWNLVNKFPHHTFWWEGLDGTTVLTHFPPGDSYEMTGTVEEVMKTVENYQDKGRMSHTMYLFGHGDGGNGPDENMLERLNRLEDISGLPKVCMSSPKEFFAAVCNENTSMLCKWKGELYLELHNGTYTTHGKYKMYNRQSEFLLYNAELLSTTAMLISSEFVYPQEELVRLWQLLLLNQFHDVIPGTSINMVYKDSEKHYKDIQASGKALIDAAVHCTQDNVKCKTPLVINTLMWKRDEVSTLPQQYHTDECQIDHEGNKLVLYSSHDLYHTNIIQVRNCKSKAYEDGEYIFMENEVLSVKLDFCGRITNLKVNNTGKEFILHKGLGNQFVIFNDVPLYWDAWDVMDYHLETRKIIKDVDKKATIIESGPIRSTVKVHLRISNSSYIIQHIILDSNCPFIKFKTEVEWNESHKFLKVEFPFNLTTARASYETQYGFLERPTHSNTSWDSARFEVCGHKWADLSEYGYGVAVLNNGKYGYSAFDNVLRLSLLRSPKSPDPEADMLNHEFTYALMPHKGSLQESGVIRQAYNLNCPLIVTKYATQINRNFLTLDTDQVVISAIKKSEHSDKVVLLRLYESFGGYARCNVSTGDFKLKKVERCNGLESTSDDTQFDSIGPVTDVNLIDEYTIQVDIAPFKVISILLYFL
ncbi:alpha-mannosidase 2C1 isoform X1 [Octopus sinensis]|uniref:alpha-mannosidase n=1 Tax=Octopus sinensis TaxID=2607531 RepID=A0A6P7TS39_9MOLL|nr:alpha-mannosidase 2C1 isoform X1 [Octopus sinensis]XP_036356315.1 alpha-mannosidase 2C1 isoform X1 [Octopus sinensis]